MGVAGISYINAGPNGEKPKYYNRHGDRITKF